MDVNEQIDYFTDWLTRCEAQSHAMGQGHRHAEWALSVWDRQAAALVIPNE